jgi:hypothetical protein
MPAVFGDIADLEDSQTHAIFPRDTALKEKSPTPQILKPAGEFGA